MKLQLNENTLNAYINEAIKQEINESGWDKLASFASKKAAGKAAKKAASKAPRIVGQAPRTKTPFNFARNIKNAKNARLSLKDFRNGKPLEMTVQGSKNASYNGQKFWVKKVDGKVRFFSDPSCKAEYILTTEKGGLGAAARSSWNSELSHMKNLLNSARRNAAGTLAVTGALGAGYGLGRNGNDGQKDPNAPWNDGVGDNGGDEGDNGGGDNGWDGTFPWDDTDPAWTPRPTRRPQPQPAQEEPQQPERRSMEPLQPVSTVNMPTGVTGTSETLPGLKQRPESFVDSARRVMAQTAAAGLNGNTGNPKLDNWKQTNRNTRRTANAAIDTMRRDGAITRNQARQDKRAIKDTERTIRRNAKEMQNQGQ